MDVLPSLAVERQVPGPNGFGWPRRFERVGWAATSNLLVRRAVLLELGGFDETTLTVVGGEDVDFGLRLTGATADLRHRVLECVVSTLVSWSFNAGQFVGAVQLGRPADAFHRFRYRDSGTFIVRRAESWCSDPEGEGDDSGLSRR